MAWGAPDGARCPRIRTLPAALGATWPDNSQSPSYQQLFARARSGDTQTGPPEVVDLQLLTRTAPTWLPRKISNSKYL